MIESVESVSVDLRPFAVGRKIAGDCAMAGLLTRSTLSGLPETSLFQWLRIAGERCTPRGRELTAAGTVADFHGIPF